MSEMMSASHQYESRYLKTADAPYSDLVRMTAALQKSSTLPVSSTHE
eukprot:CAMPEP_0182535990 /NCGR_PEP_ID=MMETSP1323-20130603/19125_1 /TAXON_ID=236787 /ORGANISM="Florenciella parvula, Strain RCC1693" /LENGTH=46 /DNA_ID= /DNA_START= /DNA_END= /DNA_ORIENTATION=